MAKNPSKMESKPRTEANPKTSAGSKKAVRGESDAKTAKGSSATSASAARKARTSSNEKPKATPKASAARVDLAKTLLKVMRSRKGEVLSPAQVRVLMMRELLSLSEVTRLLESPPKRSGIEKVGEGGFLLRAAPKAKKNGAEVPSSAASIATRGVESRTAEFTLLSSGVDFEDAFLLALCERAGAEMMVEEILRRSR